MIGRFLFCSLCLVGFLLASNSSFAKEPDSITLTPATQWYLEYAENKCRLTRAFGEGEDRHLIFFEQSGPDDDFGLTAAGPAFDKFRAGRETVLQFGLGQEAAGQQLFIGTVDTIGAALIYASASLDESVDAQEGDDQSLVELAHVDTDRAASIDSVSFSQKKRKVVVRTGNLEAPMKALNACAQDLVAYWGLDLDKHRKASRLPRWVNRDAVAKRIGDTYPSKALSKGEQGIIRLRVIVDETGAVADCNLQNATAVEALESPACKEMRRAKFEPALDGEGEPMRSFFVTRIVYMIG